MHGRDCASAIATPIVEQDNKKLFENSISLLKDIEQLLHKDQSQKAKRDVYTMHVVRRAQKSQWRTTYIAKIG